MWCKSFFLSFFVHLIIILILFFIPVKAHKVLDYVSVDFTTITIGSGIGNFNNTGIWNGKKGTGNAKKGGQEKGEAQKKNEFTDYRHIETLETLSGKVLEKNEVSLNPFIDNKSSDFAQKGASNAQSVNTGLEGYGYGGSGTGTGIGESGKGWGGKYGPGARHGGINIADYAYLRDIIMKNITYPEKARRMGWEGKVILSFVINEAGFINEVKVLKSSGYHVLDEAAKEALFKIKDFQKKHERLLVQLPIEFRLR
ncbi:MAG TPA: energy transducer TonB [Syntrophorhabdaceae bacterium]|nr:energy transducer TonB [Syntrophorhabdaceae bacterium]HPU30112.1 energy transducer TonB [Syntrophorhabdaceae bacterium]